MTMNEAEQELMNECAETMLDALLLIRDHAGKPIPPFGTADHSWCAGVAMGAISSCGEKLAAHRREHSHVPRFLPTWLGGEADRVSGPGVRLG